MKKPYITNAIRTAKFLADKANNAGLSKKERLELESLKAFLRTRALQAGLSERKRSVVIGTNCRAYVRLCVDNVVTVRFF